MVERAVVLARGKPIRFNLRESTGGHKPATPVSTRAQLLELERTSIVSGGKIYSPGGAAEILDIRPTTLASKITVLKIKRR